MAKILSLKLGMNKDTVINILGNPIGPEDSFEYAIPGESSIGFRIYVNMDVNMDNNKLSAVVIERNKKAIYLCEKNHCPNVIDPKDLEKLFSLSAK